MFLYKIFNNNNPVVFILMPVLLILVWAKTLYTGSFTVFHSESIPMPFYEWTNMLTFNNTLASLFAGLLLVALQTALVIRLNIKYIIIENRSYLPAFLFILLMGSYVHLQRLHPALCANIFMIWALDKVLASYKTHKALSGIFDASLLISCASLFYLNAAFLIVFIWIGFLIVKSLKPYEFILSLLGFITPYFFVASYYYLTDKITFFTDTLIVNFQIKNTILVWNNYHLILFSFIGLMFLAAVLYYVQGVNMKKIAIRRFYLIFILFVPATAAIFVLQASSSVEIFTFLAMPVAYLLSYLLISIRKFWVKEIWLDVFLILLVLQQILG
ncbi:MAG: hypothetical protein A2275_09995 [Bacteroidetes bacterium RIFOXYA12_FULL_35_11]|nr:MAG: hypothetical protein A2X01_09845 [Bacteroidetes bacterium GWF2_35_48]OFY83230.1 MAG: hypothetical protein A2275_09995 [Bacteroidetes bacterium RIFOXYA12_FULL_35_11]OFY92963.1 MAG: hypothetical protein A2491_04635 [Bacteroidetes bacterium RIFOXYC12_FULL_35_7]OFY94453.1 MAG: hypothetical protein A2309_08825 [Bacteroidetes bacterium RIFOXYB2_FULL_35_7]HBX51619.1 hypothetical protein [Bacteroidales bacterium]